MATLEILRQQAGVWASLQRLRFTRLISSTFFRNAGTLSGGTAIGHAFALIAAPALARIYEPSQFGVLGLFSSFLITAAVVVSLQYEVSIVSGRDDVEAEYLTLAALFLSLPSSILAGLLLWVLMRLQALGFGTLPSYTPVLMTLAMCSVGIFTALRYWCLRQERFTQVSQGTAVQGAGRALFQTVLGAAGMQSGGLLFGETVGRFLGMSRMFRSAWPMLRFRMSAFRWNECAGTLWRNRKFPMFLLPSTLMDTLCYGLTVPLLIRLYGASVGGHYSLVWRAITAPSLLVTLAVADTFHSRIAISVREAPEEVLHIFNRVGIGLLAIGGVPAAVLWFWGERLFRFVFGQQWALAGSIAAIVAPWYLAQFVVSPLSRVVAVLSGQQTKLLWDVLYLGSLLSIFLMAQLRGMTPLPTIRLLSIVNTVLFAVYYLMLVRIVSRFMRAQHTGVRAA